jgi:hypothetical protein
MPATDRLAGVGRTIETMRAASPLRMKVPGSAESLACFLSTALRPLSVKTPVAATSPAR